MSPLLEGKVLDKIVKLHTTQQDFSNLEIIKYKSLSDRATDMIRKEIITGRLLPGARVTENNIADKLGVSRVVIREAMIRLTQEGLFYKERNKYSKVVEFSKKDISDILDLRIAIETAAANKYIEIGLDNLEVLKAKSALIDNLRNERELHGIENLIRSDLSFHELIIRSTDNERLVGVWNRLSSQILALLYKYVINKQKKSSETNLSYDHSEIIEAFLKKDKQNMQDVITQHITDTKLFLIENY